MLYLILADTIGVTDSWRDELGLLHGEKRQIISSDQLLLYSFFLEQMADFSLAGWWRLSRRPCTDQLHEAMPEGLGCRPLSNLLDAHCSALQ